MSRRDRSKNGLNHREVRIILKMIEVNKIPVYEAPSPHKRRARILIDKETVGANNLALGIAYYEPREKADFHVHNGEEAMYVLAGHAILKTKTQQYELKEGVVAHVPPGEEHMLENPGPGPFSFLFVFTPPGSEVGIRTNWKMLQVQETDSEDSVKIASQRQTGKTYHADSYRE